jgi:uncharacterized protein (TIGR02444 family)
MANTPANSELAQDFWDFAVARYGRQGVPALVLKWQEEYKANVNLVLLCAWGGLRGRALGRGDLEKATRAAAGWNAGVTQPLRALRRRLKEDWHGLAAETEPPRQAILAAELEAERTEQGILLTALAPWPDPNADGSPGLATANLRAYLGEAATAAPASIIAAICSSE